MDFATQSLIRRRRALKVKKEKREKKEKKVKKRKQKVLLTEDEADDEGAGDETESEDPGHRLLGKDGGFGDGALGSCSSLLRPYRPCKGNWSSNSSKYRASQAYNSNNSSSNSEPIC